MTDANPDRSDQYKDASPEIMLRHLNAAWKQIRVVERAVGDRDSVIHGQFEEIKARDELIAALRRRLWLANRVTNKLWAAGYAIAGALCGKGLELLVVHYFFGTVKP